MAVLQSQVTVPSNGSQVTILGNEPVNAAQVNIRNTGTVTVLLGPATFLSPPLNFAVTPVQTGGTFASGATVYWKITALNALGETIGSPEITTSFSFGTSTGSANLTWTQVTGATGYKIYRSTTAGGESTTPALVTTIGSGATVAYTDTNSAASSGAVPATNTAGLPVLFPLGPNEYLGVQTAPDDLLIGQVQTTGTAGQITLLGLG